MNLIGVYLYGFVPQGHDLDLTGINGIEGDGPIRALDLTTSTAVVGEVPLEAFEAALSPEVGGPDPSWIIPRALRHEAILDAVLARSPVLPARFGTLFSSSAALEGLATEYQQVIARFFEDLGNRLEWSLRGYYDPERAIELMLASDPGLAARRQSLPSSPGTRYFVEKKLREDARRAAREYANRAAIAVRQALRGLTDDVQSLQLRGPEAPDREMILHETFLMSAEDASRTLKTVESATSPFVNGLLTLEPSGPWPPFHFCPCLGAQSE